jgi:hypothetical protein
LFLFSRTHRHPSAAVPSLCSLVKAVHQVYYENSCRDDAAIGRKIVELSGDLLEKAPMDIMASKLDNADVLYNDLIAHPIETVKKIYQQFDWTFTDTYENILNAYLEENRRERAAVKSRTGGKSKALHSYEASEFGIDAAVLTSGKYAAYIKKYSVTPSA